MLRTLRDFSASSVLAGFILLAVSFSAAYIVVFEAARASGLSPELTASWVWATAVGGAIPSLFLSIWWRQPIIIAFSIPGAAVLINGLQQFAYAEAIGAYIVVGVVSAVLGATGWMGRLLALVPSPIASAVLVGVLLPFALQVPVAVVDAPLVAGGLVVGFLLGRKFNPRFAVLWAMALGGLLALVSGTSEPLQMTGVVALPVFVMPVFSLDAILGIGLPLFIVTMAGQNAPGLLMAQESDFPAHDRAQLATAGAFSVLFAPFGCHALNLTTFSQAIAISPETHPDPAKRYPAGIMSAVLHIIAGFLAMAVVAFVGAIPPEMITALAGVALLMPLQRALHSTFQEGTYGPAVIEAALVTLAVSLAGIAPFGLAAPIWGLVAGLVVYAVLRRRRLRA